MTPYFVRNARADLLKRFRESAPGNLGVLIKDIDSFETLVRKYQSPNPPPVQVPDPMFHILLDNPGPNKISILKLIREMTGLGLKEAKDLVDAGTVRIREELTNAEALDWSSRFREAGAQVRVSLS